jgi:hypothetical protein
MRTHTEEALRRLTDLRTGWAGADGLGPESSSVRDFGNRFGRKWAQSSGAGGGVAGWAGWVVTLSSGAPTQTDTGRQAGPIGPTG